MRYVPFVAVWLVGVIAVAWGGTLPNPFARHPLSTYPLAEVLALCGLITLEAGAVLAIVRPHSFNRSWMRVLLATVVAGAFFVYSINHIMHAPPHMFHHAWWALGVVGVLLVVLAWLLVGSAVQLLIRVRSAHGT